MLREITGQIVTSNANRWGSMEIAMHGFVMCRILTRFQFSFISDYIWHICSLLVGAVLIVDKKQLFTTNNKYNAINYIIIY